MRRGGGGVGGHLLHLKREEIVTSQFTSARSTSACYRLVLWQSMDGVSAANAGSLAVDAPLDSSYSEEYAIVMNLSGEVLPPPPLPSSPPLSPPPMLIAFMLKLFNETLRAIQKDVMKIVLLAAMASAYRFVTADRINLFGMVGRGFGRGFGFFGDLAGDRLHKFFMLGHGASPVKATWSLRRAARRWLPRVLPSALLLQLLVALQHAREASRLEAQRLLEMMPSWMRFWRKHSRELTRYSQLLSGVLGTGSAVKYLLARTPRRIR